MHSPKSIDELLSPYLVNMNCSLHLEKLIIKKVYRLRNFRKTHAAFVGAEFQQYYGWSANKSHLQEKVLKKILDPRLCQTLQSLGRLGYKRKGNYLGNCAEVHAGNKVLQQTNKIAINQLRFSNAYRCRTLQIIPYCDNCLDTFNLI